MVFPRPGGPCLCGHSSSSSSRCRPSVAWGFLAGSRLFEGSAAPAAAAAVLHSSFRAMVFPHPAGPCLCGHSSSSSGGGGGSSSSSCFLLWRLFDCSSTTAAPQQQQQPPAAAPAAGSSREQQAAAGSRQPQAAAGSSRQQQTFHLTCHSAWGHVRPFGFLCLLRILPDSLVVWIQVPHVGHAWT